MIMLFPKLVSYFFLLAFFNFTPTTAEDPIFNGYECIGNETFTPNSSYQFNLNTVLSSLSSNATTNIEFYNTTSGPLNTIDRVYGLFLCRGDISHQLCQDCVANSTKVIASTCAYHKEAIIYYDQCLLRYSDRNFFSSVEEKPALLILNTANASNQGGFSWVLANTLSDAVAEAATDNKNFAIKQANLSEFQTLYSLVQCTPDLSSEGCKKCLNDAKGAIPFCCLGKQGGRVMFPSCNLRFELYPFYNATMAEEVPPIAPPVNNSEAASTSGKARRLSLTIIIVVVAIVVSVMLSCFGYCLWRKRSKSFEALLKENFGNESTTLETLQLSLATIEAATNKFSHENRIGKGGFGEVYKGVLPDGKEIAVKRLSRSSGQGAIEFKNEILLIAKLQHRNLVALLGFCLEEEEKILVYEYVSNKSLDYFLFGSQRKRILSWSERYKIIGGIARGILYLHEYSRVKIIHRDLKPSNVLLDDEMNPKISDFGLARIVAINESEGSTNRIVGTYGYMSPEYAMFGQFSEKSDVFSFGVMVLEIVSGKKNASSHESQYVDGLLSYAWKHWRDEKLIEILDSNLAELGSYNEVIKSIQISLLCVQENPDARPSMATVVSYLSNDLIPLPNPQEPAFFMHGRLELTIGKSESDSNQHASSSKTCSVNEMSTSNRSDR